MTDNQNQPRNYDAVIGGEAPPPFDSAVLGGIEGVKRRLSHPVTEVRIAALNEAVKYADAGLDVLIQALQDESRLVQRFAYLLLKKKKKPQVIQALQGYKPWNLEERFIEYQGYKGDYITQFANREVVEFDANIGIVEPVNKAYALRYGYDTEETSLTQFSSLLQDPNIHKLEALVFGLWMDAYDADSSSLVTALVDAKENLPNLKAVFISDVTFNECEISWLRQSDMSPLLQAYPQLEILQVRGGDGLQFSSPIRHNHLQALIVETGGLSRNTVAQICNMNLPALEHLELWFGSEHYGGDCFIQDISPILFEEKFPNLTYLGLRNSEFTDEIVNTVISSSIIDSISVLDISMGTLSDIGAEELLNCPAINNLDFLNISENFLSAAVIKKFDDLDVLVLANNQKQKSEHDYTDERYCSVAE